MIKKLVALAATALFSMNASAGYVKYELSGPAIEGYFFQNEEDLSIAGYKFIVKLDRPHSGYELFSFEPALSHGNISWTKARYNNQGPSRFGIHDGDEQVATHLSFNFSATKNLGVYKITSRFSAIEWNRPGPDPFYNLVLYPTGTATRSVVDPGLAEYFDYYLRETGEYPDGMRHIAPRLHVIPEPTSIALFAFGAAGLACMSRRRRQVK